MLEIIQKRVSKRSTNRLAFLLFLFILLIDKAITLSYFGFVYTDIDQLVMWNGASDYSQGIFHEPFFYGQPYNYMLESLLAAPLLYFNIPIYKALPLITSLISILPYVALAILLFKNQKYFWSYLCLALPVLLSIQYNFLTSIPRGFVQAYFFIPLLFIPMLNPVNKKNGSFLFIASALCLIANQSAILIIFPIIMYVASYHYNSISFYLKSLWVIPIFIIDYLFKYFYKIHPERILHDISGLRIDVKTFLKTFKNPDLFEYLLPFTYTGNFIYLFLFGLLAFISFRTKKKRECIFILSALAIILVSFTIPKVQTPYPVENAGIFFSISRFYLALPLITLISFYLIFKNKQLNVIPVCLLLTMSLFALFIKNKDIEKSVNQTVEKTSFPIAKNEELLKRAQYLKKISIDYQVDLMVHKMLPAWEWNNLYDSYSFNPLTSNFLNSTKEVISLNLNGDRRSWLYQDAHLSERILLIGFELNEKLFEPFDYEVIDKNYILIKNNTLNLQAVFDQLNYKIGNFSHI